MCEDSNQFMMAQKLEVIGRPGGTKWDDGSNHDGVSKIYVRGGPQGIQYMEFEYVKSGQLEGGELFGVWNTGFTETFEINHLNNEHLESVEGYYDDASGLIQALKFKTNFRVSELIGYDKGTKFSLAVKGKVINGFHGYSRKTNILSFGAYFTWIPPTIRSARGGEGGQLWDDGADHEGVTNIHVRGGCEGIQYIKFDYVKSGQHKDGPVHGLSGCGFTQTFEIDHLNDEHLVAVRGFCDHASGVIQGLQFRTNIKDSEMMGYVKGMIFNITDRGKRIVGFYGFAEKNLHSLGAYFRNLPLTKSECHGGAGGIAWDDGVFGGIKKVYVRYDITHVRCIKFEYNNGSSVVKRQHGVNTGQEEEEFVLNYPNEMITSMEVTMKSFSPNDMKVTSLIFKTSLKRTSPTFGHVSGTKFVLESKGCALVGFHGRSHSNALVAIGAYFNWLPPPPLTAEKLQAQGGDQGASWDDGVSISVTRIYVGNNSYGITYLKFLYFEDWQVVVGDDHGSKKLDELDVFEIDFPKEYITSVEGCYKKIDGSKLEVITMLRFNTNLRTSIPFGYETPSSFVLHKERHRIVGFHGRASSMIHKLGVYVQPWI